MARPGCSPAINIDTRCPEIDGALRAVRLALVRSRAGTNGCSTPSVICSRMQIDGTVTVTMAMAGADTVLGCVIRGTVANPSTDFTVHHHATHTMAQSSGTTVRSAGARGGGKSLRTARKTNLDGYLVDPASSHMLVSKIKPCMSKYKLLYSETANGSLNQLWFLRSYYPTWITVVILELIHAIKHRPFAGEVRFY